MAFESVVQQPNLYVTNLQVAYASTTTLTMAAGQARDSTDVYDMILSSAVTINGATTGANGLDTGALANATWYGVYVIAKSSEGDVGAFGSSGYPNSTAGLLSTSLTAPTLPSGYDVFRLIGYVLTNGSAQFLKFYVAGNAHMRQHFWDVQVSVLSGGSATTETNIVLTTGVPVVDNTPVLLEVQFTPATANDYAMIVAANSTSSTGAKVFGSVAAKVNSAQITAFSSLVSNAPNVSYLNSAASGATTVLVAGFTYFI